jgi:hypothetical protein
MDNNKDNFVTNIKKWVSIDNHLQIIDAKKKELRLEKMRINKELVDYFEKNDTMQNRVMISDGDIRVSERKEYSPLTFTFIEESLSKIIKNKEMVEKIIQHLKNDREIKIVNEIKRTYK